MGTLDDIVAATSILVGDSGNLEGGPGSKLHDIQVASAVKKVNVPDAAAASLASKLSVEIETIVETNFDDCSELDYQGKEKIRTENLSGLLNGGTIFSVNGSDLVNEVNGSSDVVNAMVLDFKQDNGSICLEGDEQRETNGEQLEVLDREFLVGDFVWGKIKNHPWWPGQIYDPSDASEFAVKHSQEGRLLVAFFGDGSCSWCMPSQLAPFVENFETMSKGSSSNSFLYAVQSALDEVGRIMELEMTCKCIAEDLKVGLSRPVVANAGVRAGALMPDVSTRRLSISRYEPEELLVKLKHFAEDVSDGSAIEVVFLKSWLSAYYRFKDGYPLPLYHEAFDIEGLADMDKNVAVVTNDFSSPIGVPIMGPQDDDWISLPSAGAAKSDASSDDKIYHRRKQKSVAELMGENTHVEPESQKSSRVGVRTQLGKSGSAQKRKTSSNGVEGNGSHDVSTENVDISTAENVSGEAKEESEVVTTPRERKKSKYLSPPFVILESRINSRSQVESEIGFDKFTETAQEGEEMNETAEEHFESLIVSQSVDESPNEKKHDVEPKRPDNEVKDDETTVTASDVNAPVDVLLTEIQSAALNPLYLSKEGPLDMVWDFVSAFRSSVYVEGSNYKIHSKYRTGKKRKSLNDISNKKAKFLDLKPCKSAIPESAEKLGDCKEVDEITVQKVSTERVEEKKALPSPSRLILTFTPEFPLPSKSDIMKLFCKFGSLNKRKTNIMSDSHSVEIIYKKDSDAEAAFKSSLIQSPFGSDNVNYRLQHSSPDPRPRGSRSKVSSLKRTPKKQGPADDLMSDVGAIKQKIEIMSAILENYHSKFLPEDKLSLEDEMKHLMDKVETTTEKVRIMAEKTS